METIDAKIDSQTTVKSESVAAEEVEKGSMDHLDKEQSDKKDESAASGAAAAAKKASDSEQDVVFIQDTGFTVKIVAPNLEPFDIQVNNNVCFRLGSSQRDYK